MAALAGRRNALAAPLAALPLMIGLVAGAMVLKTGFTGGAPEIPLVSSPQTVVIAPRTFSYRAPGEYTRGGYAVDAPMLEVSATRALTIMKHQVSKGDYARCVADGACAPPEPEFNTPGNDNVPATGISFDDARIYAEWLSRQTGEVWLLPTDEQLAFAAGSRFPDDALGTGEEDTSNSNPATRWLENYRRETARGLARDPAPKPLGAFGENEYGLADFGGNVWEWTTSCYRRIALDGAGRTGTDTSSCGVQLVAGQHRAAMVFFVRNPKGGGCAVGTPPDNLGFRLVKDTRWYASLIKALRDRGLLS